MAGGGAVYFLAGLIAGLAIAWYLTRQHYETRGAGKITKRGNGAVPDKMVYSANSSSEEEDEKRKD